MQYVSVCLSVGVCVCVCVCVCACACACLCVCVLVYVSDSHPDPLDRYPLLQTQTDPLRPGLGNNVGSLGARRLAMALETNTTLTSLELVSVPPSPQPPPTLRLPQEARAPQRPT